MCRRFSAADVASISAGAGRLLYAAPCRAPCHRMPLLDADAPHFMVLRLEPAQQTTCPSGNTSRCHSSCPIAAAVQVAQCINHANQDFE
jgi:hypothetical protein